MRRRAINKRYVLMWRWAAPCLIGGLALSYLVVRGAVRDDPAAPAADGTIEGLTSVLSREVEADTVRFRFEDVTDPAGITFRHFPDTRRSMLPEDMGSGAAWGDYDNDGDPDLFLVNFRGSILDDSAASEGSGRCALYRNEGDGHFTDVSSAAGADLLVYGLGAAWGDYDNDDDLDLSVTCYGPNVLLRNDGDGTFTDVSAHAGVDDDQFGAGCVWADYDRDGFIDLYVCNYVRFAGRGDRRTQPSLQYGAEIPYTINPSSYPPAPNRLYHNDRDGTFTEVAAQVGVANAAGRSLGAVWFDFDEDGWTDLYVANDVSDNGVFRNQGDGTFADIGARSLAADYRGAMGLAVGDQERDGDLDLFVTHWIAQENAYFENMTSRTWGDTGDEQRILFMDSADRIGLGQVSLNMVGWATGFVDLDDDGYLDLWVVNGNTLEVPEDHRLLKAQRMHIFWNRPGAGFYEIGAIACPRLAQPFVGRGGAYADYDSDGRMDLLVMVHGGRPILLHNTTPRDHHWVTVKLRQAGRNTRALGAWVTIRTGDLLQKAQVGADGSYLSQHQMDLHFGLGQQTVMDELVITWPDGEQETHRDVAADRIITFERQEAPGSDRADLEP